MSLQPLISQWLLAFVHDQRWQENGPFRCCDFGGVLLASVALCGVCNAHALSATVRAPARFGGVSAVLKVGSKRGLCVSLQQANMPNVKFL